MAEGDILTPEQFDGWIKAHHVLALFGSRPTSAAKRLIADRLAYGLLRSAARHWIYRGSKRTEFAVIPAMAWGPWAYEADGHFWEAGDTKVPIDSVEGIRPSSWDYDLFDVRFDPVGLREMGAVGLPAPDGPSSTNQSDAAGAVDARKPPSPDAYEKWKTVFLATHGSSYTADLALRSARAMFPDNQVTRAKVRELIPPQKPGKPVTRQKSGE